MASAEDAAARGPACQVEGCTNTLLNLRDYHLRYKICAFHSTVEQMMGPDGLLQRFCQQCGRFHLLTAFDGSKRSCRDGLARHNARRRRSSTKKPNAAAVAAAVAAAEEQGTLWFDQQSTSQNSAPWDLRCSVNSSMPSPFFQQHAPYVNTHAKSQPLPQMRSQFSPAVGSFQLSDHGWQSPYGQPGPSSAPLLRHGETMPAMAPFEGLKSHSCFEALSSGQSHTGAFPPPALASHASYGNASSMSYGEHAACFISGPAFAGSALVPRRPTSWPLPCVKAEPLNPALPTIPFAAMAATQGAPGILPGDVSALDMVMLCEDVAGDDDMWGLLVGHPGATPGPHDAATSHANPYGGQPEPNIRVLGENQSLQSLWDNLQPHGSQPNNLLGIGGAPDGAAHAAYRESNIFDTNVSLTSMVSMQVDAEQLTARPQVVGADLAGMHSTTPSLGSFHGFKPDSSSILGQNVSQL